MVLHVRESPFVLIDYGRYLAAHIAGATLIELPGGHVTRCRVAADALGSGTYGSSLAKPGSITPHS